MRATFITPLLILSLAAAVACGGEEGDPAPPADAASPDPDASAVFGCVPDEVNCVDDHILDFSLHNDRISEGDVVNAPAANGFVSTIDATAGGFGQSNEHAFLYMRFEDSGLVKVDIDDETALESKDWDIAARRFIVRLNGGNSGPACAGALAQPGMLFDEVAALPADTEFSFDNFYDTECALVEDDSGLPGSPEVALTGWWGYTSCVTTTGTPFVVALDSGRQVALEVEQYYESGQQECNDTGNPGGNSGTLRVRWRFLQ